MLQLFQAEWCPSSRRIRQRLTELGLDYVTRQVPAEKPHRHALRGVAGTDGIPTLVLDDSSAVVGEDAIRAWLDTQVTETTEADAHKQKAEKMHRRQLEEECECFQPATP
jgi:glutathione S-transferase